MNSCKKDPTKTERETLTLSVTQQGSPTPVALPDGPQIFLDATKPGALSYQWKPGYEKTPVIEFLPNDYFPGYWNDQPFTKFLGGYEVVVGYADSVVTYFFAAEYIDSYMACPNSFSPNGDGLNDFWAVACYPDNLVINSTNIYNASGKKIYSADASHPKWYGTYEGKTCDIGTYYFTIDYTNTQGIQMAREGEINIMR